jgi:hypothetical protein
MKKMATILILIVYAILIVLPPIIYGYVYPNVGDDASVHLAVIDNLKNGDSVSGNRYGAY